MEDGAKTKLPTVGRPRWSTDRWDQPLATIFVLEATTKVPRSVMGEWDLLKMVC